MIGFHFLATCLAADSRLSVSSSEGRRLITGRMSCVSLAVNTGTYVLEQRTVRWKEPEGS